MIQLQCFYIAAIIHPNEFHFNGGEVSNPCNHYLPPRELRALASVCKASEMSEERLLSVTRLL